MKRIFYFLLLTTLLALPAVAQEADVTDAPEITVTEQGPGYTVTVNGDGLLSVQVITSPEPGIESWVSYGVIADVQVNDTYSIDVQRNDVDNYRCLVKATAQADGKLVSEMAVYEFTVVKFTPVPEPSILFTEIDDTLEINVLGQGPVSCDITINGVNIGKVELPYYVERQDIELYIEVSATAEGNGLDLMPSGAYATYVLAPRLVADPPEFYVESNDEYTYVLVGAYSVYPEAEVHMFLDDHEVDNPIALDRTYYEDYECNLSAYVDVPGMQRSEMAYFTVVVPVLPREKTATPIINCEEVLPSDGSNYVLVTITPSEEDDAQIFYRYQVVDYEYSEYSDWMPYNGGPLCFNVSGCYQIEAYAVAENKEQSETVVLVFVVREPTAIQLYDFEEDGIFYKITADGKVSVCSETAVFNTYGGVVTIPTTVTHNGETYMVNGIADNAFRDCTGLTGVNIGAYVTTIGDCAFQGCTSLTSVTLGDYVTTLGKRAFAACSALADVKMGSGMRDIGEFAFSGCSALTSVTCKAATPPYLFHKRCFDCYSIATLHVYPAVLDSYRSTTIFWSQFSSIVAEDNVAPAAGDVNGDGQVNISDVTTLINMLLKGN